MMSVVKALQRAATLQTGENREKLLDCAQKLEEAFSRLRTVDYLPNVMDVLRGVNGLAARANTLAQDIMGRPLWPDEFPAPKAKRK